MTFRLPACPALTLSRFTTTIAALVAAGVMATLPAHARPLFPPSPDPMLAAPAGFEVSLTLPAGVGLMPGSAALVFEVTDGPGGMAQNARAALVPSGPARGAADGGHVLPLHLAQPDDAGLDGVQAIARGWKAAGAMPRATLSVTFTPCKVAGTSPRQAPFALALRLAPGAPLLGLSTPGATLDSALGADAPPLQPCP